MDGATLAELPAPFAPEQLADPAWCRLERIRQIILRKLVSAGGELDGTAVARAVNGRGSAADIATILADMARLGDIWTEVEEVAPTGGRPRRVHTLRRSPEYVAALGTLPRHPKPIFADRPAYTYRRIELPSDTRIRIASDPWYGGEQLVQRVLRVLLSHGDEILHRDLRSALRNDCSARQLREVMERLTSDGVVKAPVIRRWVGHRRWSDKQGLKAYRLDRSSVEVIPPTPTAEQRLASLVQEVAAVAAKCRPSCRRDELVAAIERAKAA